MANAVEHLLRKLITAILMDKSGYKLRDNRYNLTKVHFVKALFPINKCLYKFHIRLPLVIGVDCPNPWLLSSQQKKPKVEAVSELAKLGALQKFHSNDGGIIPLVRFCFNLKIKELFNMV